MYEIDDSTRMSLYSWIDQVPLSRRKRKLNRDFSDGVLVAEIINHFLPKSVELHNYTPSENSVQKQVNWTLLNRKVFKKILKFELDGEIIREIVRNENKNTIDYFLLMLKDKINVELMMASPRMKRQVDQKNQSKQEPYQSMGSMKVKTPRQADISWSDRRDYPTDVKQKVIRTIAESDNVPRILYEEKDRESQELNKQIGELNDKIQTMEELVRLKDMRIQYAEQQIEYLEPFVHRRITHQRYE